MNGYCETNDEIGVSIWHWMGHLWLDNSSVSYKTILFFVLGGQVSWLIKNALHWSWAFIHLGMFGNIKYKMAVVEEFCISVTVRGGWLELKDDIWNDSLKKKNGVSWKLLATELIGKELKVLVTVMKSIATIHFRHFERTEMIILFTIGLIKNTLGEKWLLLIWKIRNSYR